MRTFRVYYTMAISSHATTIAFFLYLKVHQRGDGKRQVQSGPRSRLSQGRVGNGPRHAASDGVYIRFGRLSLPSERRQAVLGLTFPRHGPRSHQRRRRQRVRPQRRCGRGPWLRVVPRGRGKGPHGTWKMRAIVDLRRCWRTRRRWLAHFSYQDMFSWFCKQQRISRVLFLLCLV